MDGNVLKLDLSQRNLNDEEFYAEIAKYPNLQILYCNHNQITNVDHLPSNLQILDCRNNQIINVDHLPSNLQILDCDGNKIASVDHLPSNLQILDCRNTQITNVDHLPSSLQKLYCYRNQITKLDYLPPNLQELYCNNNNILNKLNHPNNHIKRSRYLRFCRNKQNTRKTHGYLCLEYLQKQNQLAANCLPNEIIKHIISFV